MTNDVRQLTLAEFDGKTYNPALDRKRLTGQLLTVFNIMRDSKWRTLSELCSLTPSCSETSVSARLRDLRKPKFGEFIVERRRRGDHTKGLYEYRLVIE